MLRHEITESRFDLLAGRVLRNGKGFFNLFAVFGNGLKLDIKIYRRCELVELFGIETRSCRRLAALLVS